MEILGLVLLLVSLVLAAIAVVQSRFVSLLAWAVVAVDVALLLTFGDRLFK